MCCDAEWKREIVPDHKFDFINVREFHKVDILTRLKYIWKYILILKTLTVYGLDIFTASTLILSSDWTNTIQRRCGNDCAVQVQFVAAKWVFVGCIIFSFLLLGYESYKAHRVVKSRDISYAFTNLIANDYYSLRSYDNFCLFCHIDNSTKKKDDFAFFIYFTFKDWKRLLLADGPRQSINALILYSFGSSFGWQTSNIPAYWDDSPITAMLLFSMIATVLIFAGSLVLLIVAGICYVPLLCYIQGNLKEYVCHKVDKRISEMIKKKQRQRIAKITAMEKKMAQAGTKNTGGEIPQPTLPNVSLDDEDESAMRIKGRGDRPGSGGRLMKHDSYDEYAQDYPPNAYELPYGGGGLSYGGDYGSSTNLASHAAPLGISYPPVAAQQPQFHHQASYGSTASALPNPYSRSQSPLQPSRSQNDFSHQQRPFRGDSSSHLPRYNSGGLPYDQEPSELSYAQPPRGYVDQRGYAPSPVQWDYRTR